MGYPIIGWLFVQFTMTSICTEAQIWPSTKAMASVTVGSSEALQARHENEVSTGILARQALMEDVGNLRHKRNSFWDSASCSCVTRSYSIGVICKLQVEINGMTVIGRPCSGRHLRGWFLITATEHPQWRSHAGPTRQIWRSWRVKDSSSIECVYTYVFHYIKINIYTYNIHMYIYIHIHIHIPIIYMDTHTHTHIYMSYMSYMSYMYISIYLYIYLYIYIYTCTHVTEPMVPDFGGKWTSIHKLQLPLFAEAGRGVTTPNDEPSACPCNGCTLQRSMGCPTCLSINIYIYVYIHVYA